MFFIHPGKDFGKKIKTPPLYLRKWGFDFFIPWRPLWFDVAIFYPKPGYNVTILGKCQSWNCYFGESKSMTQGLNLISCCGNGCVAEGANRVEDTLGRQHSGCAIGIDGKLGWLFGGDFYTWGRVRISSHTLSFYSLLCRIPRICEFM